MPRDGKRVLSDDERVLWTTVAKSIKPLRGASLPPPGESAGEPAKPARSASRATSAPSPPARPAAPPPPPLTPLGRRKRGRVARGKEAIDGRLDLHGLTQSEAHAALLRFLRAAAARSARLVLVITGKGANLGGGDRERGVLRRQLPQWLALPEFRAFVIGFEQASARHGGEGAWYISVRRDRTE
jgi:DNA-nicking Smr family endonuclease